MPLWPKAGPTPDKHPKSPTARSQDDGNSTTCSQATPLCAKSFIKLRRPKKNVLKPLPDALGAQCLAAHFRVRLQ